MAATSPHMIETLAKQAAKGDTDALGELFDHYADNVVRFLVVRVHNHELALDLASATWEKVARSISTYEYRARTGGFPAWLFTIARRTASEHARWRGRRPECLDGEMLAYDRADGSETPAAALERKLESHQIAAEIDMLPMAQRKCVMLRFFVGLSVTETAEVLGKTPGAVKQLQFRGLSVLRERLGGIGLDRHHAPSVVASLTDSTALDSRMETHP